MIGAVRRMAGALLAAAAVGAAHAADLDAADLGAFLDGYLPVEMDRADIAGVGIAVVKDGKVLLARGYGHADRERGIKVDPAATLFRIGSVSKLFTWMAVMRLAEQGKLDLDADIQQYLDFPLRAGPPITLRLLMTHRAGFEETIAAMWAQTGESLALRDYLVTNQPARIFAPGAVPAYSNYGATLAGYIVERRSGERFDAYVERHLLEPMGMVATTFAQPLPAALAAQMSRGYGAGSGKARDFETIRVAPAGSASASALDMARFMLAELGQAPGALTPAARQAMQAAQWRHHPQGPGLALGYYEEDGFGQRVIGHGGDTQWFHTGLYLLPERGVGLFISQNSAGKRVLRDALFRRFVARYFPVDAATAAAAPAASAAAIDRSVVGRYIASRRNESGPLALINLLGQTAVSVDADGRLTTSRAKGLGEQTLRFQALGNGVWQVDRELDGQDGRRLFFARAADGRWQMSGRVAVQIEQQARWWQDASLLVPLLAASLGTASLTLLGWPIAAMARRHYGAPAVAPALQAARRRLRWSALLMLAPWLLLGGLALYGGDDLGTLTGLGITAGLRFVPVLGWLQVAALALALWAVARQWRAKGCWWGRRAHGIALVLAVLGALAVAVPGRMLLGV